MSLFRFANHLVLAALWLAPSTIYLASERSARSRSSLSVVQQRVARQEGAVQQALESDAKPEKRGKKKKGGKRIGWLHLHCRFTCRFG